MPEKKEQNYVRQVGNLVCGPEINYELLKGGIGKYIFDSCLKHQDKVCQIYAEDGSYDTFSTFLTKSRRVAIAMQKRGIRKSDMIIHCSPNTLQSALPVAAGTYLGAISSSLDPSLSSRDCAHLVKLIQPKLMFVHEDSVGLIEETLKMADGLQVEIVVMGKSSKYVTLEEFLVESKEEESFRPIYVEDCNETIFILFSSGTTGLPKGICLGHQSLYCGTTTYFQAFEDKSCLLHFTTFYWISALMIFTGAFAEGNKRLLLTGFNPNTTFNYVEKYKVSHMFLATSCVHQVVSKKDLSSIDTSSLKYLILGGGPVSAEQMRRFRKALPHTYSICGYGMTEIGGCISAYIKNEEELSEKYPNSCGRPVNGITVKVVDVETGKVLGMNQSGEIRLKYAHKMNGYHKQDSSAAYDEEGYIKTGDIGHYDESLSIYVYDRLKEMFKYQSWHIVPASIEGVVKEHPAISQVVVFGIPDEIDGDLPAAAVTLVEGSKVTGKDIEEFVAERVQDRQRLRGGVFVVDRIPTTPSGKVLRRKAREEVLEKLKLQNK